MEYYERYNCKIKNNLQLNYNPQKLTINKVGVCNKP